MSWPRYDGFLASRGTLRESSPILSLESHLIVTMIFSSVYPAMVAMTVAFRFPVENMFINWYMNRVRFLHRYRYMLLHCYRHRLLHRHRYNLLHWIRYLFLHRNRNSPHDWYGDRLSNRYVNWVRLRDRYSHRMWYRNRHGLRHRNTCIISTMNNNNI